jgi:hypothetical protein
VTARWSIEEVDELRGYVVEWVDPEKAFLSRRNRIYRASSPEGEREPVAKIPAPWWKAAAARARPAQRLLRFMAYNLIPLPDRSLFITFDRQPAVISDGTFRPLRGAARPFRVLRQGCALAKDGGVYLGEYLSNQERGPVRVYKYAPGTDGLETVHVFSPGEARHVHGVYADPYSDDIYCVTGDRDPECRILVTRDGFDSMEAVGEGDETWRTVSLLFTSRAIFYASDAEFNENFIYRIDRKTGERTTLARIDGPVYYSRAVGEDLLFAVTAELCPSQEKPEASIWHVSPSGEAARIFSSTKDLVHNSMFVSLFMPGTICFPSGPGADHETYMHGIGLRGIDNKTLRMKITG